LANKQICYTDWGNIYNRKQVQKQNCTDNNNDVDKLEAHGTQG